jgi:hypothetical protein
MFRFVHHSFRSLFKIPKNFPVQCVILNVKRTVYIAKLLDISYLMHLKIFLKRIFRENISFHRGQLQFLKAR